MTSTLTQPSSAEQAEQRPKGLFAGLRIWFSQRVPQRTHFSQDVLRHGGQVVNVETQADVKIADHTRKDAPPDAYSFSFVEKSLRKGVLEKLDDHAIGSLAAAARPGGTKPPPKGTRMPFSAEDDRILYDWVTDTERKGGRIKGNKLYEELAAINPRHTAQSWRDRWIKHLSNTSRADLPRSSTVQQSSATATQSNGQEAAIVPGHFDAADFQELLNCSDDIMAADESRFDEMWAVWAEAHPPHSGKQWHSFFTEKVLPVHNSLAVQKPASENGDISCEKVAANVSDNTSHVQAHSPSFQPSSPVVHCAPSPILSSPKDSPYLLKNSENQAGRASEPGFSKKRKLDFDEATDKTRFSRDVVTPRRKKRRQHEVDDREIPSTPEHDSSSVEVTSRAVSSPKQTNEINSSPAKQNHSSPEPQAQTPMRDKDHSLDSTDNDVSASPGREEESKTQAIFNGPTQVPDFLIAEPEGGWGDAESEPNLEGDQGDTQAAANQLSELDAWINEQVAAGNDEEKVLTALRASTMDADLAQQVLECLAAGGDIPSDVRGVWTEEEDLVMRGDSARAIAGLKAKHGSEAFDARWKFLDDLEVSDEE